MSHYLSTYLEAKHTRREQRSKRRNRIAAGLPVSVPLKVTLFSPEQRDAIAAIQTISHQGESENQLLTPKRVSALVALSFHLIAALIGARFVVQGKAIHDDTVIIQMIEPHQIPKRRLPSRRVKGVETSAAAPRIQIAPLERPITTGVEIPREQVRFTLPPSDISIAQLSTHSAGDARLRAEGLESASLVGVHRTQMASVIPKIEPQRSVNPSIMEKIEATNSSQVNLNPDPVDPLTGSLSDGIQSPQFLRKVTPRYPETALRVQREGVVWVEALIGVDGIARDIQVIKGIGFGCDEAAIEALKASRFTPAMQGEKRVSVRIQIPYRFSLSESAVLEEDIRSLGHLPPKTR